jgi:hypothetical protein
MYPTVTRATSGASHLKGREIRAGQSISKVIRNFIGYSFVCAAGVGSDSTHGQAAKLALCLARSLGAHSRRHVL